MPALALYLALEVKFFAEEVFLLDLKNNFARKIIWRNQLRQFLEHPTRRGAPPGPDKKPGFVILKASGVAIPKAL